MTVTGYEKGIAGHEVVAIFDKYQGTKNQQEMHSIKDFRFLMSGERLSQL